jgi:hypothetical protein
MPAYGITSILANQRTDISLMTAATCHERLDETIAYCSNDLGPASFLFETVLPGLLRQDACSFSQSCMNMPGAQPKRLYPNRSAIVWLLICLFHDLSAAEPSIAAEPLPLPVASWPATDGLGRRLPVLGDVDVPPIRQGRFVGLFYFLWHNNPPGGHPEGIGPFDISKILARDPDAAKHSDSPLWGPMGMAHYWAESLYGYYRSTDPWVIRRHAQLLTAAGIDTLIFDTTNAETYPDVYLKICEVFEAIRKAGGRTPRIAFMVNTEAGRTVRRLYGDFYQKGLYRDLWFIWQGKPLLICDPKEANAELSQFFTLRRAHWPHIRVNTPYAWHWEAIYPQVYGYTDDPAHPEQVNVSAAQNLRDTDGRPVNMSAGNARGRSFHDGKRDLSPGALYDGGNFQEQWRHALKLDPPFVMVTGWNEWVAQRFGKQGGPAEFVDQFDREYSRDIEPMKGGHADNYYYQLVANVRRFKGIEAPPRPSAARSIAIDGTFDQWKDVAPRFYDDPDDTLPRDFDGAGGLHYTNRTGRNDLTAAQVAHDAKSIFFHVRTRDPITPQTGPNWMWLLINIDRDATTGWEGYDFIVNRSVESDGTTWLEKNSGGWKWNRVVQVRSCVSGNHLHLAIPRSALGLSDKAPGLSFDFKWADNLQHPGDIMDFYVSGDVAPEGRFMFRYRAD